VLEDLLLNQEKRRAMGMSGQTRAESLYLIDSTVQNIVSVMKQSAEEFHYQVTIPRQLSFASILGSYASRTWTGEEYLAEDQALDIQRMIRTGPPQDLILLKNNCLNHLRPDHGDERFRLLRRGIAVSATEHDRASLDSSDEL